MPVCLPGMCKADQRQGLQRRVALRTNHEMRGPAHKQPSYVALLNVMKRVFGLHLYAVQVSSSDSGGEMPRLPREIEVRILSPDEIRSYVGRAGLDFRQASVEKALARGDVCVAAFKANELVSYNWRAVRGPVPHTPNWEVIWEPGLVYRYKALTLPDYRGLHINEALAKTIDRHLATQGYVMGLSFVECTNLSSMRTLKRKGRIRVGYAGYFQRFGVFVPFRTVGCRAYGFAFRRHTDHL